MTHYLALTCEALARSIYTAAANSSNTISIRLFRQGLHNTPKILRAALQDEIDALEADNYDAILLAYGICGTSTVGLVSGSTRLVIPRAHDCITLYLGSHQRYLEEFNRHPGTYWYSVDYLERNEDGASVALRRAGIEEQENQYEEYVRKYGKESADAPDGNHARLDADTASRACSSIWVWGITTAYKRSPVKKPQKRAGFSSA